MSETPVAADAVGNARPGRIEGGYDAIVIGGGPDGLTAAAYLGKAGLKTVLLLESGAPEGPLADRAFGGGFTAPDTEHFITALDPRVARELRLYRRGLSYANRRIATAVYADGKDPYVIDGDISRAKDAMSEYFPEDADAFGEFVRAYGRAGERLSMRLTDPSVTAQNIGDAASAVMNRLARRTAHRLADAAFAATSDVLSDWFKEPALMAMFAAETALRGSVAPSEPYGFLSLLSRFGSEAAGLPGGVAVARGGVAALGRALVAAVEAAKVEIRKDAPVKRILVEFDTAAGVELAAGGQIRAPIVVSARGARRTFLELIGPASLDLEFHHAIRAAPAPRVASAKVHIGLSHAPDLRGLGPEGLLLRLLATPPVEGVDRAFFEARAGRVPEPLIVEAACPSAYEATYGPEGSYAVTMWAHPVPFTADAEESGKLRKAVAASAVEAFARAAPGVRKLVRAIDVRLPTDFAATYGDAAETWAPAPAMLDQWLRVCEYAGHGIDGFGFCGPEAQIGPGVSCAAGRRAAAAVLAHTKRKAAAQ